MNLSGHLSDGMDGLGAWTEIGQGGCVSSHWLEIDGRRILFLESSHFSARGKCDEEDFYGPMAEAIRGAGLVCPR